MSKLKYELNPQSPDCQHVLVSTPASEGLNYFGMMYYSFFSETNTSPHRRKFTIEYSTNCCDKTLVNIAPIYPFSNTIVSCNPGPTIFLFPTTLFVLRLNGINGNYVSQIEYADELPASYTTIIPILKDATGITYSPPNPLVMGITPFRDHRLKITTLDNFVYEITIRLEPTDPQNPCVDITSDVINVLYPNLPSNVFIYNSSTPGTDLDDKLSVNQLFLGLDTTTPISTPNDTVLLPGVYNIIVCDHYLSAPNLNNIVMNQTTCIQESYFLACDLKCELINKLISCKDSDIFTYYTALQYSNDCTTAYQDKCSMYELMINKLNSPGCYDPYDDCNCNDSTDSFFKQRSMSTNNGKVNAKPCGCS